MRRLAAAFIIIAVALGWLGISPALEARTLFIVSPDHAQTFVFGTETQRAWTEIGPHKRLGLILHYTNDPYVDRDNPRRYDSFIFSFPSVELGADGRAFYYRAPGGHLVPVARKRPDLFGFDEIKLLPNARVEVNSPDGFLSVTIVVFPPKG